MCYSIPAKLVEVKGKKGTVDYFGQKRKVILNFVEVKKGDYVYAQGGVVVRKLAPQEAVKSLRIWEKMFFTLKEKDEELSKIRDIRGSFPFKKIVSKIKNNEQLTKKEMLSLLELKGEELKGLYSLANNIRQKRHGNSCCIHGIIEFSNFCKNNCLYCGIRKDSKIERYRISEEEIIEVARYSVSKLKFKALLLQSGEDDFFTDDKLISLVRELRRLGILVMISVGCRSRSFLKRLFEEGARGSLLRFEMANQESFHYFRPYTSWHKRWELIKYLKRIGYTLGSGFLFGLPKETVDDILENILLLCKLNPAMFSCGPFIPSRFSPLKDAKIIDKDTALKIIALMRILKKKANILVTTALETLDKDAKKEALLAGANSLMINLTPYRYRKLYTLYDNKANMEKDIKEEIRENINLLYFLGRAPTDIGV